MRSVSMTELAVVCKDKQYPALWDFVRRVALDVGSREPENIIVGMTGNFYVTQATVELLLGPRLRGRTLYLSAPLMRIMTPSELKAVLGHEFSHFTGRDTLYSTHVGPGYRSLQTGIQSVAAQMEEGGFSAIFFALPLGMLRLYQSGFSLIDSAISRKRELRCDEIATQVYGRAQMSGALVKVVGYGTLLAATTDQYFGTLLGQRQTFINYPEWFGANKATLSGEVIDIITQASAVGTDRFDSHPALKERLTALGVSETSASAIDLSMEQPGCVLGIDNLEQELTRNYTRMMEYMIGAYQKSEEE